jgi:DNA topoisomerase-2
VARLHHYNLRKRFLLEVLEKKLKKMKNKARYIQAVLDDELDLRRKKSQELHDILVAANYDKIDDSYKYLIKMPMDSVTEENVAQIMKEKETTEKEIETLTRTRVQTLWSRELHTLESEYDKYKLQREKIQASNVQVKAKTTKKKIIRKTK